jgi:hypothetical protein
MFRGVSDIVVNQHLTSCVPLCTTEVAGTTPCEPAPRRVVSDRFGAYSGIGQPEVAMPHQPPQYPVYYTVEADYPLFGAWKGDVIQYDPTAHPSIVLLRYLPPNHGGLLLAVEDGAFKPAVPDPSVVSLHGGRAPASGPSRSSPAPVKVLPLRRPESA